MEKKVATSAIARHVRAVHAALERHGLLLVQAREASLVTLVAGESLRSSWWGHPQAHTIFRVLNEVTRHPDVVTAKLVAGKVTLVHRRLWPALLAVATALESWQTRGLSAPARRLLKQLEVEPWVLASGAPIRELERRLLLRSEEVHTDSGEHRLRVERWEAWAERVGCRPVESLTASKLELLRAVQGLGASVSALPWYTPPRHRGPA